MFCPLQPGDRIRLTHMPQDPDPIPIGSEGTVRRVRNNHTDLCQIDVDWDNGRTLMLIPGIDRYAILKGVKGDDPSD